MIGIIHILNLNHTYIKLELRKKDHIYMNDACITKKKRIGTYLTTYSLIQIYL